MGLPQTEATPLYGDNTAAIDVAHDAAVDWSEVQRAITTTENVISSRFILGEAPLGGYGYAKNTPDRGYVV